MTGEEIARELGIHYDGYQKGRGMQFTDIQRTGTTFYADTLEIARTKLAEKRELFGQSSSTMYHATHKENWASIAQEGLKPYDLDDGLDRRGIYLSTNIEDLLKKFVRPGLGVQRSLIEEGFAKEGKPFLILEVKVPKDTHMVSDHLAEGWGYIVFEPIPPERIKAIREIWNGIHEIGNNPSNPTTPIGTCYSDAWRYVARHTEDQPVLVHGTISGLYGRMGHAWVELPDGTVYDAASQVTMPIEKYYSLVDPIVEDRYTADEAMHMLSVGNHGPWSAEERMEHIGR